LEEDIAADTEALASATALRNEENDKFEAEEADMKETLGLLAEAVSTLSKVQLLQKPQAHKEALLQVRNIVRRVSPKFGSVMQKDLFDMLGEFKVVDQQRGEAFGKKIGNSLLPRRSVFAQARGSSARTEQRLALGEDR